MEIQSAHNGRCLNVFGGFMEDDTPVHLWDEELNANPHNVWRLVPAAATAVEPRPGLVRLQSVACARCMSVKDGGSEQGTRVVVWEEDPGAGNPHSVWRVFDMERTVGLGPGAQVCVRMVVCVRLQGCVVCVCLRLRHGWASLEHKANMDARRTSLSHSPPPPRLLPPPPPHTHNPAYRWTSG